MLPQHQYFSIAICRTIAELQFVAYKCLFIVKYLSLNAVGALATWGNNIWGWVLPYSRWWLKWFNHSRDLLCLFWIRKKHIASGQNGCHCPSVCLYTFPVPFHPNSKGYHDIVVLNQTKNIKAAWLLNISKTNLKKGTWCWVFLNISFWKRLSWFVLLTVARTLPYYKYLTWQEERWLCKGQIIIFFPEAPTVNLSPQRLPQY